MFISVFSSFVILAYPPRVFVLVVLSFFSGTEAFGGLGCVRFRWVKTVEGWERWVEVLSLLCDEEFLAGSLKTS